MSVRSDSGRNVERWGTRKIRFSVIFCDFPDFSKRCTMTTVLSWVSTVRLIFFPTVFVRGCARGCARAGSCSCPVSIVVLALRCRGPRTARARSTRAFRGVGSRFSLILLVEILLFLSFSGLPFSSLSSL